MRRIATLVAALGLVASALGAGAHPTAASAAQAAPTPVASASANTGGDATGTDPTGTTPVRVTLVPDAAGRLTPDAPLNAQVTVTNTSAATLSSVTVQLDLDRTTFADSAAYRSWIAPAEGQAPRRGSAAGAPVQLPALLPGQSSTAQLTVPADQLGLSATSPWGARALSAIASAEGEQVVARSAIVFDPGTPVARVALLTAAPVVAPVATDALISSADLAADTAQDGALTRELDAIAGTPTALGVDPRIVASIRVLGNQAPASAQAWLQRLEALPNETFPLAYGDADVAATSQARGVVPAPESFSYALDPTRFPSAGTPTPTPTDGTGTGGAQTTQLPSTDQLLQLPYSQAGIAWPADDTVTGADLPRLAGAGLTTTIVDDSNLAGTGTAATPALAASGDARLLVSNGLFSSLLRDAAGSASAEVSSEALARLSAALAVVSAESGGTAPTVLATLDRAWATEAGAAGQQGASPLSPALQTLGALPWVGTSSLAGALAGAPAAASVADRGESADRLATVGRMIDDVEGVGGRDGIVQFAAVANDPSAITAPARLRLLTLLSVSWRNDSGWSTAAAQFSRDAARTVASVHLVSTSQINVLSDRETLPISISNALPVPVTVVLAVRSSSPQLIVDTSVFTVPIEPDSTVRQQLIPIRSIGNGTTAITVTLTSVNGTPIGPSSDIAVNVQAEWEVIGAVVFIGLVVALLVVGVWRTVRRRRRLRNGVEEADA